MTNPLLQDWETPFGLPPFSEISDQDFGPALDDALDQGRAAIAAIADNPEPPSFTNTIEALERADKRLDQVAGVFYNLAGADSTPAREALQREFAPKLSAYSSEITNNAALWARINALWQARETLGLTKEQALATPHAIICSSTAEAVETLQRWRERWGISYIGLSSDAIDSMAPVVAELAGS